MTVSLLLSLLQPDVEAALAESKKELGGDFSYGTCLNLYVIATDGGGQVLKHGIDTVRRVHQGMHKFFMTAAPTKPLKIYLFRGKESYVEYNKKTSGREPTTPYGFYRSAERKIIMNIATGYGTLVHELLHPLLEADFPLIPSWFNEGFASLFEQTAYTADGGMRGDVNWRLPALQKAIEEEGAPSLKSVIESSSTEFYGAGSGLKYATARYLCLYLQSKELLVQFYASFRKGAKDDPTGLATLEKILGQKVDRVEPAWRKFVSALRYP